MTATSHDILVDGEIVGRAITLGSAYVLYTVDPRLKQFDEYRFSSLEALRAAVTHSLATMTE